MAKYKLDELCEFITDGTHQTPEYCDDGVIFLSSKDVTERKINWDDVRYIPDELHEKLYKRLSPRKNDILLAKNGTTGVAAIVDRDEIFDVYVSLAVLRPLETIYPKGNIRGKYVSKKIKEVIRILGKDIKLYGPIYVKTIQMY